LKNIINLAKVRRNSSLSHVGSILGLFVLFGSLLLPYYIPGLPTAIPILLVLLGLGLAMAGIFFANRWVRKPRPELEFPKAFDKLSDDYVMFHYPDLPADHILLTPAEVYVLETVNVAGFFTLEKGKWSERMKLGRALRYVVEEHVTNPSQIAIDEAEALADQLGKLDGLTSKIDVKPMVVFIHPSAIFEVDQQPIPILTLAKAVKHVRSKGVRMPQGDYDILLNYFKRQVQK
jgi:hypothetical protein